MEQAKQEYPIHKYLNASFLQKLKLLKQHYPNFGNEPEGAPRYDYIRTSRDLSGHSAHYYRSLRSAMNGMGIGMGIENVGKRDLVIQREDAQEMFLMLDTYEKTVGPVGMTLIPDWENGPFLD